MGDDSDNDWLKKKPISNPIRMSLRRSNRFFPRSPDMDASLISNHGKQGPQSLAVPRIIRRTSVNLDRFKEMKFKVPPPPAPVVQEKANVKKQTMGIPRPYGATRTRQSTIGAGIKGNFKPNLNSGIPKSAESAIKQPQRPSMFFGPRKSTFAPSSSGRKPNIVERLVKLSESCAKYDSERSILESSRVINQSTPNDPSAPRSILKQTQSATKRPLTYSKPKQDTTDKPKAAKKVNFNEKENQEEEEKKEEEEKVPQIHDFGPLEESTIAFADSFKPIAFDEPKVPEKVPEKSPDEDISAKNYELIDEIINSCQAKWEEMNVCHMKFKSLREAFASEIEKRSQFDSDETYLNKFHLYRARRDDILNNFKRIDKEFDEAVKNKIDVRSSLQKYLKDEENLEKELNDVHGKFKEYTESLRRKPEKPVEEFKNPTNPVRRRQSPNDKLKRISDKSKAIKKPPQNKTNSRKKTAIYNDLQRSLNLDPLGSSPDELSNTPDNTPAKRRRLSKKIQRQLNTLFEDE